MKTYINLKYILGNNSVGLHNKTPSQINNNEVMNFLFYRGVKERHEHSERLTLNFNPFPDGDADYGHVMGCWAAAVHLSPRSATGPGCGTGSILLCATMQVHPRLAPFSVYCGL